MLLDQSLFAPLMICFFFIVSETLAGKRPHEINEMLKECYVQTLMITNLIQDLVPCRDSEFYVCNPIQHRVCPNCSNILERIYLAVMDG